MAASKVGTELPDATLWENNPHDAVKIRELCADKKCIIVSVPGAFTPTCSNNHLPGFLEHFDALKECGVDLVIFVSVNDPFVMAAWGKDQNVGDKIKMLADTQMELTKGLDVVLDATPFLGSPRSHRFAAVVENNTIKSFFLEEDPSKTTVSSASAVLSSLKDTA